MIRKINLLGAVILLTFIVLMAKASEDMPDESPANESSDLNKSIEVKGDESKFNNSAEQETAVNVDENLQGMINPAETKPIEAIKKGTSVTASFGVYLQIVDHQEAS